MKRLSIVLMLILLASHQATAQDEAPSRRAYLGIQLQAGALVGNVDDNGPAQAAGIEPGDLIVRFDGKAITRADELLQIIGETPIGKDVTITLIRRGKEGTTTVKLGQRLVFSGPALDAYRQKLGAMLEALGSLGAPQTWNQATLQRFSELFAQFEGLKRSVPPEDPAAQKLWDELERKFQIYKSFADDLARQIAARKEQPGELEQKSAEQLAPLYANYMTLQVCGERFHEFDDARSGLREFLKNKEAAVSREVAENVWNAAAETFQRAERALERADNAQLYAECEQAAKQASAVVSAERDKATRRPQLRRKDF